MAKKPDGKPARTERVTFTRPAADRIAKVVRTVEAGNRDGAGLYFGVSQTGGKTDKQIRICTFTGSWSIGSSKTVTYKYQTTTPNTVNATNLFWPLSENDPSERDCSIGKDGTAWFLIVPRMFSADAATAATITTATLEFKTLPVAALASSGTAVFTISITTCATATA